MKNTFWAGFLLGALVSIGSAIFLSTKVNFFSKQDYEQLTLFDIEGRQVPWSEFDGKPLVVNYWATWCKPCIEEFPKLEQARALHNGRVAFVMISDDKPKKAKRYIQNNKYGFSFLLSKTPLNLSVRPVTYFYNKNRKDSYKQIGALDSLQVSNYLNQIDE